MTEFLQPALPARCQADDLCDRPPCFQARLEVTAPDRLPTRLQTELCAQHLGGSVQALSAWAREQGLEGKVTILAIDQPERGMTRCGGSLSQVGRGFGLGFVFASVAL
jgi:hypothetical protein